MIPFVKMHGLGNDFVILEAENLSQPLEAQQIIQISDRRFGVGCDQLIVLSTGKSTDVRMRIYNADGREVEACGNATRCVGFLLHEKDGKARHSIETVAGELQVEVQDDGRVCVDLGTPILDWAGIPLSEDVDTLHLPIACQGLVDPVAVSVGNPHMVFFTYDAEAIDLETLGQKMTGHPLYTQGTNVEVVEVVDPHTLRMRVFERGVGITPACGTGACASVVAAVRRRLVTSPVTVVLDGGTLSVTYDQTVRMTGDVTLTFRGTLAPALMKCAA